MKPPKPAGSENATDVVVRPTENPAVTMCQYWSVTWLDRTNIVSITYYTRWTKKSPIHIGLSTTSMSGDEPLIQRKLGSQGSCSLPTSSSFGSHGNTMVYPCISLSLSTHQSSLKSVVAEQENTTSWRKNLIFVKVSLIFSMPYPTQRSLEDVANADTCGHRMESSITLCKAICMYKRRSLSACAW